MSSVIETDQLPSSILTSSSPQSLLKQYEQSLTKIITELRVIVHNIHEESGNPLEDIALYLSDIKDKMKALDIEIKTQHEQNKQKGEEVLKLKLQIKAIQNDYSEMKSSLFLQVQEQKLIVNRMREELKQQKELQQAAINQFMTDIERKNQELRFLKQNYEDQLFELKGRLEGISLSSIKSYQLIEEEGEKQRQRILGVESQREKTIANYTELIAKQREQIKTLLLRLKDSSQGDQNRDIIDMIDNQSQLMGKIQELEASLMSKDQQISKISTISKSQNKKCREYYQKLRIKEEQAEDLKSKMNRYTRDSTIRQSQIAELRTTLQKVVKEREQSSKYMGTKWQHEIDRVLLNAQLQFDREKNRLKKAAEERQQQVQDELNQKINKLKVQVKGLKQNKTKLIDKVKQLEEKLKVQANDAILKIDKLKEELMDVTNARNILMEELEVMTNKYQQTCNVLKTAKNQKVTAEKQLEKYKQSFETNKKKVQHQSIKKIEAIRKQVNQQKHKVVEKAKEEHTKLTNTFVQKQKKLNIQIEQKLKSKEKGLMATVENIKRQQQDTIKLKLIQIEQVKQQTQKQFQKSLKTAKKQFNEQNQEHLKVRAKFQKQLKQALETIQIKQQQISHLKGRVEQLLLENKNTSTNLTTTTKQKDEIIRTKQSIIQSKIQQYNNLYEQKSNVDKQLKQIQAKYSLIRGQINDLKQNTMKQISILVEQHDKMIKGYRSYIRQLQDNCFTHSDIMVYVREIRKLRQVNTEAETDLANMQSKLLTLKQVSKYQVTKMEQTIKSDKFNSTMRSLSRVGNSQGSLTRKSVENGQKFTRYNNQHSSGYTHYGSIDNLEGGTVNNFNIENSGNTGYEKLSKHKKRLGTSYQRSRMKKSRVGFTEIDTYSILTNTKQEYRFNSFASPEGARYVRSALNK